MPHKKETDTLLSAEDTNQVQLLLAEYHQLADSLHRSDGQAQAEAALADIHAQPEAIQIAWLKALSKEQTGDAADVLAAINAFSPHKEVRKEARRSLIRLEATKTYPSWTPPTVSAPAVQLPIANPPRFWKGFATEAREEGEIQLLLCWEQGYDYSEVRILAFLLDFWQDGVKAISIDTTTKRRADERISELRTKLGQTALRDCTLAEGKRLLEEALSVNAWRGTQPHEDYRAQIPLINKLILQATDVGEDRGQTFITTDMEDQEVLVNFLGGWSMGDYGLSYDLLAKDSDVRDGLTRDEWIERHRAWSDEAHPARMELGFVHERKNSPSSLWLPTSASRATSRKEVEVGWSLELSTTPLSGTLKEMPMGTAVNKETRRHWFWTSYVVVREAGVWRMQKASDEGARSQGLPITELQSRIKEHEDELENSSNSKISILKKLPCRN